MPSLRTLLTNKARSVDKGSGRAYQSMLEKGEIYFYTAGGQDRVGDETQRFCWISPGCGNAVIEAWGASGSGAKGACCGTSVPGNPAAYARKTIEVFPGSFVCGFTGMSCGDADTACFRGCSEFSGVCWCTCVGSNSCMCAMGGRGGFWCCYNGGNGPYCCWGNLGACVSQPTAGITMTANCGIVCNYCNNAGNPPDWVALAYGGDVNCCGGFSCMTFTNTAHNANCNRIYHIRTSAGVFSEDGAVLTFQGEDDTGEARNSSPAILQQLYALNATARSPSFGKNLTSCWNGSRPCGCYQVLGCVPWLPYGVPGVGASVCCCFCDHGIRGGYGAVRIQFLGS